MLDDVSEVLDTRFWEPAHGANAEEFAAETHNIVTAYAKLEQQFLTDLQGTNVPVMKVDRAWFGPAIDAYYEAREGMLVTYADTLAVGEYFELARYGQIELYEGGRPRQYTADNVPTPAGYAAHLDGRLIEF